MNIMHAHSHTTALCAVELMAGTAVSTHSLQARLESRMGSEMHIYYGAEEKQAGDGLKNSLEFAVVGLFRAMAPGERSRALGVRSRGRHGTALVLRGRCNCIHAPALGLALAFCLRLACVPAPPA